MLSETICQQVSDGNLHTPCFIEMSSSDRRPYNQLTRCSHDPLHSPENEDLAIIYRPLFWTSFWAEDWLFSSLPTPYRGASSILVSSASSKTAFCLAYLLRKRRFQGATAIKTVGLTSKKNLSFTNGLGLYDAVLTYNDDLETQLDIDGSWVYVDVASNSELNGRILGALKGGLVRYVSLGLTNLTPRDANSYSPPSSGVTASTTSTSPEFFFMPEWLAQRRKTLKISEIANLQTGAWSGLMEDCKSWISLTRTWGAHQIQKAYEEVIEKGVGPEKGLIWSLWNEEDAESWQRHGAPNVISKL